MNKTERLTAILLMLQQQPHTSESLARRFEVSRRTVLRDVQALSEMGVPIIAREGVGGGYSLPADFALPPLPLSAHEAFLLLLALGALTDLADTPFAAERASLAAKVRALLPEPQWEAVAPLLKAVRVAVPQRGRRAPHLDALVAAAQHGQWLRVTYQSAERTSTRHLQPRQVYAEHGCWYCRAYTAEHGEERTYRVDRIQAAEPAGADFRPPPMRPALPYDHPSHPLVEATLTPRGVVAVESEPHLEANLQRQADGTGRLAFRCPPDELAWCARYFASLGDDVIVLGPPELRQRLRALGEQLAQRYAER